MITLHTDIRSSDGTRIPVIVPTRYHTFAPGNRRFPLTATVDFIAECGFDGMDLSLDTIDEFSMSIVDDNAWRASLFTLGNRAAARGLTIPVCHLPFAMPAPDDERAMTAFARSLSRGLDAAAFLHIPVAVIHPIVRHSSRTGYDAWLSQNIAFLSLLRKKAHRLGVQLAVENMTGIPYPGHPDETVYGSRAEDLRVIADRLDMGICWDTGHAHLTGLNQATELTVVGDRLRMLHLHDNDGRHDRHLIPFTGTVDWQSVADGLRTIAYPSMSWRCLNLELKTSDLSPTSRLAHAAQTLAAARKLAGMV